MKRTLIIAITFTLFACLAMTTTAKSALDTVMIFIEAEDCILEGYQAVSIDGAVGKAIQCSENDTSKFTVKYSVPAAGQYSLWLKVSNVDNADNSLKYTINDGIERVFDFMENVTTDPDWPFSGKWFWMQMNERGTEPLANGLSEWAEANGTVWHTPVYINAAAGENSITFVCREFGHYIDQIIITDDLAYQPGNVPGNSGYLCGFCNMEHFILEPYADLGISIQGEWNKLVDAELAALETEPPVTEAEPVADAPPVAAQTNDFAVVSAGIALTLSAGALLILKRQKNKG
ncbi:MAG: hypothetical protein ACYCWE_16425 [Eubacteriales bacterium]